MSALGSGCEHVAEHSHAGWTVRTCRAPILKNHKLSVTADSHNAWRRELSLTRFAGQELPAAIYGGNSLELRHDASGVRLSFCALEALRAWALLDLPPVRHRSDAEVLACLKQRDRLQRSRRRHGPTTGDDDSLDAPSPCRPTLRCATAEREVAAINRATRDDSSRTPRPHSASRP